MKEDKVVVPGSSGSGVWNDSQVRATGEWTQGWQRPRLADGSGLSHPPRWPEAFEGGLGRCVGRPITLTGKPGKPSVPFPGGPSSP